PILDNKIKFIKNDLEDFKYNLEEAKRHSPNRVKEIEKEIQSLKDEIKAIQNSYKNAKITIQEPFRGLNKIVFTIDESHEISYKTDAKAYSPFYLEIQENIITLHPVAKTIIIEEK
ncbi:MAG TPA: hypothetical protein EYG74_01310, partial [Sulfurimonas autotrophica]|nr:hypothetical protein [Sulfurimonas autotrophica]